MRLVFITSRLIDDPTCLDSIFGIIKSLNLWSFDKGSQDLVWRRLSFLVVVYSILFFQFFGKFHEDSDDVG